MTEQMEFGKIARLTCIHFSQINLLKAKEQVEGAMTQRHYQKIKKNIFFLYEHDQSGLFFVALRGIFRNDFEPWSPYLLIGERLNQVKMVQHKHGDLSSL